MRKKTLDKYRDAEKVTLDDDSIVKRFWVHGGITNEPEYRFNAKIGDVGTKHGIDGGRISKLEVRKGRQSIVSYDRGWDRGSEPGERTTEQDRVLAAVTAGFPENDYLRQRAQNPPMTERARQLFAKLKDNVPKRKRPAPDQDAMSNPMNFFKGNADGNRAATASKGDETEQAFRENFKPEWRRPDDGIWRYEIQNQEVARLKPVAESKAFLTAFHPRVDDLGHDCVDVKDVKQGKAFLENWWKETQSDPGHMLWLAEWHKRKAAGADERQWTENEAKELVGKRVSYILGDGKLVDPRHWDGEWSLNVQKDGEVSPDYAFGRIKRGDMAWGLVNLREDSYVKDVADAATTLRLNIGDRMPSKQAYGEEPRIISERFGTSERKVTRDINKRFGEDYGARPRQLEKWVQAEEKAEAKEESRQLKAEERANREMKKQEAYWNRREKEMTGGDRDR